MDEAKIIKHLTFSILMGHGRLCWRTGRNDKEIVVRRQKLSRSINPLLASAANDVFFMELNNKMN